MPILLKHKKHIKTRLIPIFFSIILFALLPFFIEIIGKTVHQWFTGTPCTQQNCFTYGITWFSMITIPLAILLLCILIIISFIDLILSKKAQNNKTAL